MSRCAVCLDDLSDDGGVALTCYHVFHDFCIDPWLRVCSNCPVCRAAQPPPWRDGDRFPASADATTLLSIFRRRPRDYDSDDEETLEIALEDLDAYREMVVDHLELARERGELHRTRTATPRAPPLSLQIGLLLFAAFALGCFATQLTLAAACGSLPWRTEVGR